MFSLTLNNVDVISNEKIYLSDLIEPYDSLKNSALSDKATNYINLINLAKELTESISTAPDDQPVLIRMLSASQDLLQINDRVQDGIAETIDIYKSEVFALAENKKLQNVNSGILTFNDINVSIATTEVNQVSSIFNNFIAEVENEIQVGGADTYPATASAETLSQIVKPLTSVSKDDLEKNICQDQLAEPLSNKNKEILALRAENVKTFQKVDKEWFSETITAETFVDEDALINSTVYQSLVQEQAKLNKQFSTSSAHEKDLRGNHPLRSNGKNRSFNIQSFKFQSDFLPSVRKSITPIFKVTEFQPQQTMNVYKRLRNSAGLQKQAAQQFSNIGQNILSSNIVTGSQTNAANAASGYTPINNDNITGIPWELQKGIFGGIYVAEYELPYFGEDPFLQAKQSEKWKVGSGGKFGNDNGQSMDYMATPSWELDSDDISFSQEILLFNDSFENLVKNFTLVQALFSGNMWIQNGFQSLSPNVYTIESPGYFCLLYCSADFEVSPHGIKRCLRENMIKAFNSRCGTNLPFDTMFPDFYKLKYTFKSLSANNYNMTFIYNFKGNNYQVTIGDGHADGINGKDGEFGKSMTLSEDPRLRNKSAVQRNYITHNKFNQQNEIWREFT